VPPAACRESLRACLCVFSPPLSPPSLLKVREAVEHGRRQGGELVVGQFQPPAGDTRERGPDYARQ
jgi:hypothetical protein